MRLNASEVMLVDWALAVAPGEAMEKGVQIGTGVFTSIRGNLMNREDLASIAFQRELDLRWTRRDDLEGVLFMAWQGALGTEEHLGMEKPARRTSLRKRRFTGRSCRSPRSRSRKSRSGAGRA